MPKIANELTVDAMREKAGDCSIALENSGNIEVATQMVLWIVGAEICERLDKILAEAKSR